MYVLFHIGLAKTGSTYLQRWFAQHPDILRMDQLFPIIERGQWRLQNDPQLTVLSDERFASWIKGWSTQIDPHHDVRDYQRRTRDYLYALCPHARILLVTRAPNEGLVRSIYSQYVKTGGKLALREFFNRAQEPLRAAFDWDYLLRIYEEQFGPDRVLALPYELMCDDRDAFLEAIEAPFGLSRFRLDDEERDNRSIGQAELLLYQRLNRLMASGGRHRLGHRAFRLYMKALNRNWLLPVAKLHALTQRSGVGPLEEMAPYAEALRPATTRLLEHPHYRPYRPHYAPDSPIAR